MNFMLFSIIGIAILSINLISADDSSTGFFLKVTKNVPRLGRRATSDFEKYFLKASKSVPRIGRRDSYVEPRYSEEERNSWYERLLQPSKRLTGDPNTNHLNFEYNFIQPADSNTILETVGRNILHGDKYKFISWKDFDVALVNDKELYDKLKTLGQDASLQNFSNMKDFIPIYSDSDNDILYYRTDRDASNLDDLQKEKIDYQI